MSESTQESRGLEQTAHFTQSHIDLAVLRVRVENQAEQIAAMAAAVKTMSDQMVEMNKLLSEAKGGWKVLVAVAGAAGVLGSAATWIVSHFGVVRP